MKKTNYFPFVALILVLNSFSIFSQDVGNYKNYSIVYINDGSYIKGYELKHNTSTFNPNGSIVMKDISTSKRKKIKVESIDSILNINYLYGDNQPQFKKEYDKFLKQIDDNQEKIDEKLPIKSKSKVVFLEINGVLKYANVITEGKVNLYKIHIIPNNKYSWFNNHYYVRRNNEHQPYLISKDEGMKDKQFKKRVAKYFDDCSELVEKTNNGEYRTKHIVVMVKFYNKIHSQ